MNNKTNIHFDGICIYLHSQVGSALIGKIILIIMNLIAWSAYIFGMTQVPGEELKSFVIPFIIIFIILVFIVGRFTCWNLWGEEFVRINTKSLSYSRSYGFISTTEKVIKLNTLSVSYEKVRFFNDVEHGRLLFFDYDELNNPIEIFQTTVLISKPKIDEVLDTLHDLFEAEKSDVSEVCPFSLN
ncbi:hypothetical protein [Plebeiibacterium sediminum]|uniref:Uncharacterized protein n=1 Tax=Plebeiibacterium sediminum TaxID=2992112 RepID=A0AAE3M8F7_9BACT|nr:hypothetical protein [Plebeiobacterium sediminum]MCW3789164.1 hypothetical protein [Plebeiobacterium sediminum]